MTDSDCPICGQNDAVQSVAYAVTSGTQNTVGAGVLVGGITNPQFNLNLALYGSHSKNGIASRLTPTTITPGNLSRSAFWLIWMGLGLIFAIWFKNLIWHDMQYETWFSYLLALMLVYLPGFLTALIPFLIFVGIYRYSRPRARLRWQRNAQHLWESYYCYRDDVAFDDLHWASPEEFVAYAFEKPRNITLNIDSAPVD